MTKKKMKFAMVMAILLLAMVQAYSADCGDVNSNGQVDIVDGLLIAQRYVGLQPANFNEEVADVNDDGEINIVDALQIAKFYIGLLPQLECAVTTPTPSPTPNITNPPVTLIMPLGDSITDGMMMSDMTGGGYRINLWKLAENMGAKIDFVGSMKNGPSSLPDKDHEGHSGWTTSQIDSNINNWMSTYKPRIVLLHIGTNDMRMGSPDSAASTLGKIIDKICAQLPSNGKLYVSNIIPFPMAASQTQAYNAKIPGIVQEKANSGKPVYFVEMFSKLTQNDLDDGVHPNHAGYDKMGAVWFEAIRDDL